MAPMSSEDPLMHLTMSRPLSFVYRPLHSTINHRAAQRDDIVAVHCIVSCIVLEH